VTDEERAMLSADDAELLNMVRAGDSAAFQILFQRHEQAARRLARDLVVNAEDVDDVLAETSGQVMQVIRLGGGPADAFRPYLLTALRRVCDDRYGSDQVVVGQEDSLIAAAFMSLPERWMAVLWHTDIEGASPAEVAPLLGLSPAGVTGLRRSARDGMRQAYLQMYASGVARPDCSTVAVRLGAFIQDAVSGPDSAMVTEHLSQCDDCRAAFTEMSDVSIPLRAKVAPVFLGGSADYYLSGPTDRRSRAAAVTAATTAGAAAGAAWWLRPGGLLPAGARPLRWLAAGSAAVVAVGAVALAVSLNGHGSPLKQTSKDLAQAAASPSPATIVARPSATAAKSATTPVAAQPVSASKTHSAPTAPPASQPQPPATSPPSGSPSPAPSPVRLTAAVDVYGHGQHWNGAVVIFKVSDTGSAKSRALIVSVALPSGSWFFTWSHGPGHGHGAGHWRGPGHGGQNGWSCRATASGARCRHAAIPAGGQSQGTIFIGIGGSSACGDTVSVTAASGSVSADAQSPEEIQC
jgi:DNA-directed RNA polymerase specialized sigma24 family protein